MKRFPLFCTLFVIAAVAPSFAASIPLYTNGTQALGAGAQWIDGSRTATDSFTVVNSFAIDGLNFNLLAPLASTPISIKWTITSTPFGTPLASGVAANLPNVFLGHTLGGPFYGYNELISIPSISFAGGTYWLQLSNAIGTDLNGNPSGSSNIYWDGALNGASISYATDPVSATSEYFQVLGSTSTATPEPSTFALLATGVLGATYQFRRRKDWR